MSEYWTIERKDLLAELLLKLLAKEIKKKSH